MFLFFWFFFSKVKCADFNWQVYLFHAFPVIELDSVNVIFDIDLSYRTWEESDFVCRDDGHVRNVTVMVIWLGLLMPTTNLNIYVCSLFGWLGLLCWSLHFLQINSRFLVCDCILYDCVSVSNDVHININ